MGERINTINLEIKGKITYKKLQRTDNFLSFIVKGFDKVITIETRDKENYMITIMGEDGLPDVLFNNNIWYDDSWDELEKEMNKLNPILIGHGFESKDVKRATKEEKVLLYLLTIVFKGVGLMGGWYDFLIDGKGTWEIADEIYADIIKR